MKKYILASLVLMTAAFADAQTPDVSLTPPKSYVRSQTAYDTSVNKFNNQQDDLADQIASDNAAIQDAQRNLDQLKKDHDYYRTHDGCSNTGHFLNLKENCLGAFSSPDREEHMANYDKAQATSNAIDAEKARIDRLRDDLKKDSADAKALEKQRNELAKQEKERMAALQRQAERDQADSEKRERIQQEQLIEQDQNHQRDIDFLKAQIKRKDVQSAFADLDRRNISQKDAINMLEQQYDMSLMGIYMARKITLLMDSKLLCNKVNECLPGKQRVKTNENDIREIFPNIDGPTAPQNSRSSSGQR